MPDWLPRRRAKNEQAEDAATWSKCPKCSEVLYRRDLAANLWVCPRCGHHFRMSAIDRINITVDGDFKEIGAEVLPGDPLEWVDKKKYAAKLAGDREKSQLSEAVICGTGKIGGFETAIGVMDFHFRGGTMGTVVGERIAMLLERARELRLPCVIFTASGAVARYREDGNFLVTVLTDPTTGGVSASFAFQADVIAAEPKAMVGFAGRRVIEQTIRQKLPDQFQTAEFLLEKGHIDMVVPRPDLKATLTRLLDYAAAGRAWTAAS
jgi:acetyl-CoA carboxylase carboxyl transferase subunit beta